MMKIKIGEPSTEKDFKEIIRLIEDNIVKYVTTVDYLKSYSSGEILLAKQDGEVVGALLMRKPGKVHLEFKEEYLALNKYHCPEEKIGFVIYAIVSKNYQGKGIGKLMVAEALRRQRQWGARAVGVHCWQGSPGKGSQKLFASMGFRAVKMHKAIWKDDSEKMGPKGYWCVVCGNPCVCDELEMMMEI